MEVSVIVWTRVSVHVSVTVFPHPGFGEASAAEAAKPVAMSERTDIVRDKCYPQIQCLLEMMDGL